MKRVIYSLYVDIPAEEHYGNSKIKFDTTEKASITINAFKKHYKKLLDTKKHYASRLNADFLMFENDFCIILHGINRTEQMTCVVVEVFLTSIRCQYTVIRSTL